jgi:hypothetical protein
VLSWSAIASSALPSRIRFAISATVVSTSSCAERIRWMSSRSPVGAAASIRASVSLNRLFSRRMLAMVASSLRSSAIAVKFICMASACSMRREASTRVCASSRSRLCLDIPLTT